MRGVRTWERSNPADPKVSEEGEGRGVPVIGTEIPLPMERSTVSRTSRTLLSMEDHVRTLTPCRSPWREAHTGAGCMVGSAAYKGSMVEHSVPDRLYPMERTHAGQFLKDSSPWKNPHWSCL